jgi:hypothetical protein
MKPGHIRVFDGLRVTTGHLEHLQGSFHSAVEELRLAVGRGLVQDGFTVEATDDTHVTVQPGLAFDFAGNRIACEEPTVLEVGFPTDAGTRYVCLRYEQVEDAVVEGQATIVWDSCAVLLADRRPSPDDNLVPIAELRPRPEALGFEVRPIAPGRPSCPGEATAADAVAVSQGVLRMEGAGDDPLASPALREALRRPPAEGTDRREARLVLAERGVVVGAWPCSLSLQAMVTATVRYLAEPPGDPPASDQPAAGEPAWAMIALQARTVGEATVNGDQVAQFGFAELHRLPPPGEEGPPWWCGSHLTEEAIAHLPVWAAAGHGGPDEPGDDGCELLGGLQVLLRVEPGPAPGLVRLRSELSWSGGAAAQPDEVIGRRRARMEWGIVAAWKGLGQRIRAQDGEGGS